MRTARLALAVTAVGAAGVLAGLWAAPVSAAGCASMTLAYDNSGHLVVLHPAQVEIRYGGCVQFTNSTLLTASFHVAGGYSQQVPPGSTTSGSNSYVGTASGAHAVTATSGPAQANGSITVASPPPPTSSPRPTHSPSPAASHSPSPRPSASRPTTQPPSTGTPVPSVSHSPRPPAGGHGGGHGQGGGHPVPTFTDEPTVPSPLHTPAVVVGGGPLEPPTSRSVGLPAAIAALLVVGGATGLVRVVLAEPVDGPDSVGSTG